MAIESISRFYQKKGRRQKVVAGQTNLDFRHNFWRHRWTCTFRHTSQLKERDVTKKNIWIGSSKQLHFISKKYQNGKQFTTKINFLHAKKRIRRNRPVKSKSACSIGSKKRIMPKYKPAHRFKLHFNVTLEFWTSREKNSPWNQLKASELIFFWYAERRKTQKIIILRIF